MARYTCNTCSNGPLINTKRAHTQQSETAQLLKHQVPKAPAALLPSCVTLFLEPAPLHAPALYEHPWPPLCELHSTTTQKETQKTQNHPTEGSPSAPQLQTLRMRRRDVCYYSGCYACKASCTCDLQAAYKTHGCCYARCTRRATVAVPHVAHVTHVALHVWWFAGRTQDTQMHTHGRYTLLNIASRQTQAQLKCGVSSSHGSTNTTEAPHCAKCSSNSPLAEIHTQTHTIDTARSRKHSSSGSHPKDGQAPQKLQAQLTHLQQPFCRNTYSNTHDARAELILLASRHSRQTQAQLICAMPSHGRKSTTQAPHSAKCISKCTSDASPTSSKEAPYRANASTTVLRHTIKHIDSSTRESIAHAHNSCTEPMHLVQHSKQPQAQLKRVISRGWTSTTSFWTSIACRCALVHVPCLKLSFHSSSASSKGWTSTKELQAQLTHLQRRSYSNTY